MKLPNAAKLELIVQVLIGLSVVATQVGGQLLKVAMELRELVNEANTEELSR